MELECVTDNHVSSLLDSDDDENLVGFSGLSVYLSLSCDNKQKLPLKKKKYRIDIVPTCEALHTVGIDSSTLRNVSFNSSTFSTISSFKSSSTFSSSNPSAITSSVFFEQYWDDCNYSLLKKNCWFRRRLYPIGNGTFESKIIFTCVLKHKEESFEQNACTLQMWQTNNFLIISNILKNNNIVISPNFATLEDLLYQFENLFAMFPVHRYEVITEKLSFSIYQSCWNISDLSQRHDVLSITFHSLKDAKEFYSNCEEKKIPTYSRLMAYLMIHEKEAFEIAESILDVPSLPPSAPVLDLPVPDFILLKKRK